MEYIIAGLGNPGKEYEKTRHNAGFLAIDRLAERLGTKINKLKFKSMYGHADVGGKKVLLLKPQTYMNNSGIAIFEAAEFYKVPAENIIIICDDIALPTAKLRIRRSGSPGGHNGLKSISNMMESDGYPRVKIGISDRNDRSSDLADWVIGNFGGEELKAICNRLDDVAEACEMIVKGNIDGAMAKFN